MDEGTEVLDFVGERDQTSGNCEVCLVTITVLLLGRWKEHCFSFRCHGALPYVHEETEVAEMMIEIVGPEFEIIATVEE
jgi:hypothetical protein